MSLKVYRGRTLARSQALQLLFQAEATDSPLERVLEGDFLISKGPLDPYALELCRDRKSTRLNSSHGIGSRMPSSA